MSIQRFEILVKRKSKQIKIAARALSELLGLRKAFIELTGEVDGESRRAVIYDFMGEDRCPAAIEAYLAIGSKYEFLITTKTGLQIAADANRAAKSIREECLEVVDSRLSAEEVAERQRRSVARRVREDFDRERRSLEMETLRQLAPAGAKAVIVAEFDRDTSDSMTDYFAHTTDRAVVIGFRMTSRESFPRLRQAAAAFPPTAHLGPNRAQWVAYVPGFGNFMADSEDAVLRRITDECGVEYLRDIEVSQESVEHRDNYSMGGGNYLKSGGHHSTGWRVSSQSLTTELWPRAEFALHLAPSEAGRGKGAVPVQGAGFEILPAENRVGEFALVVLDARLAPEAFVAARRSAEAAGGWYSRAYRPAKQPGGFGFPTVEAAQAWAEEFSGTGS